MIEMIIGVAIGILANDYYARRKAHKEKEKTLAGLERVLSAIKEAQAKRDAV